MPFYISGTDTTSTFLEWAIIFLQLYPDVQAKLIQEISKQLGDRMATLRDRPSLPYVDCFIEEVFRRSQMVDIAVAHYVTHDTVFKGYLFPKGTQVFADMSTIRNDPTYWKDPEEFRPERFLTKAGRFQPEERIGTFGIGKRRCMGEILARSETFLFTVGLVQNFEFKQVKGVAPNLDPVSGMVSYPKEFDAIVKPRF